jgi:hypothetical protein
MRALVLVLFLGMLAAGCGGGNGGTGGGNGPRGTGGASKSGQPEQSGAGQPLPQGYTRASAGNITLAHPPGWRQVQPPKGWALALEYHSGGAPVARIGVITAVPHTDDPSVVSATAFAGVQLQAKIQRREPDRPINVPGAGGAIRVDYTYADSGNGLPSRGADISVVYGNKQAVVVRIVGLQNTMSLELADRITRTITVNA